LDENADQPALVLVHHNPGKDGTIGGLKDTSEFFDVIRPRRHVKAFIYGHTHDWKVTPDESGIHLINLPPVAYTFKAGQPSGWVHATLDRSGMDLELRCVTPAHPQHGQKMRLKWRK
jgi:predicted phosphodiesterase